ncbi:hypothetical protein RJ640_010545 [Escallonia rubra]|uniref:Pentatricopeptide repeat-containing protein n=1 Tax=Escallonia rubra TaxID=112253 RepID=A0AA88U2I6_9ASTE|nr:hypothetical protein RJ640_010545 [Escallonia rubra]
MKMKLNAVAAATAAAALARRPPLPHSHGSLLLLHLLPPPLLQFFSFRFHSTMASNPQSHRIDFNNIKKLEHALFLFDEMLRMRPLPSTIQFTQLLTAVTKMKHYSDSIYLYKEIGALGIPLDEYTMNIAINCFCHLNAVNCGFAILGSFFRRGILPNVATFSTLLKGLVLEDRVPEAVELFLKLMRKRVCEPNEVMYGTIDRVVDDALTLFSEMIEKCVLPNVITYNSLVHGLCNNGRLDEAIRLLREMGIRKISPTAHTFTTVVDALCKEGMAEVAEGVVLQIMRQRGVDPDVATYSSLIDGYCMHGQMDEAGRIFDSMIDLGLVPDVITYNVLINGYCKSLKMDEAMHLLRELP